MRIFVLCTGRCGSTTFAEACCHMTNYTAAHESNWGLVGLERLSYPKNHIEVDNRLTWMLGALELRYGHRAFYVHLMRDREATAESFYRRWRNQWSIIRAYADSMLLIHERSLEICRDYVDCVNANIRMFLKDKPLQMDFHLESRLEHFPEFWQRIGAEGDFDAAMNTFMQVHNPSATRTDNRGKLVGRRALKRLLRMARPEE